MNDASSNLNQQSGTLGCHSFSGAMPTRPPLQPAPGAAQSERPSGIIHHHTGGIHDAAERIDRECQRLEETATRLGIVPAPIGGPVSNQESQTHGQLHEQSAALGRLARACERLESIATVLAQVL